SGRYPTHLQDGVADGNRWPKLDRLAQAQDLVLQLQSLLVATGGDSVSQLLDHLRVDVGDSRDESGRTRLEGGVRKGLGSHDQVERLAGQSAGKPVERNHVEGAV